MQMSENKLDRALFFGIIISYTCFFISTVLKATFWIDVLSPVTVTLTGVTIMACLSRMGRFWLPSFWLATGILFYAVADIMKFFGLYILFTDKLNSTITFVYLLPNYFFGISVGIYFIQKLKGRQFYQFLTNTLILTVIGFVFFRKGLIFLGTYDYVSSADLVRIYLYFTINFFILIMIGHMAYMIAGESGFKKTNTMILGILVYILLDIPYTLLQALGKDPENIYTNLVYALCMILMAYGVAHQARYQHIFKFKQYDFTQISTNRKRIRIIICLAICVVMLIIRFLNQAEFLYLVLALASYWIMTENFRNSALNEQILKQQDLLTGLYNRRYCNTVLEESVRKAQDQGKKFAVFYADLNSFKPINDTYGHDMGDRVLKEFGNRMLALPEVYTSFRTGGDEFMIVRDGIHNEEELMEAAQNLQELFHSPMTLDTYVFTLSGSIGISVFPDDSRDPEVLMRYADAAMYAVKRSKKKDDYKFFDRSLVESVERHKDLEEKIKNSEPERDFVLHYQPRFDAINGKLIAAEVLPRLKGYDSFTAADILPVAEDAGIMNKLGIWLTDEAIRQVAKWRDENHVEISFSINLSPLQLVDVDFIYNLKRLTKENHLDPARVNLDISNEAIMGASITAKDVLKNLTDFGFKLSLNNFGGGDINLFHFLDCKFSSIHISQSLIKRADTDEEADVLIKAIIELAENVNSSADAIGIESEQQAKKLKAMGARYLQGFYFGKPVKAEEFTEMYIKKEAAD